MVFFTLLKYVFHYSFLYYSLSYFEPMFSFYTPQKHQKIKIFQRFSGSIELEYWLKVDYKHVLQGAL